LPSAAEPGRAAGFTLLEVLVALVILGFAAGILTGAISDSLARAQRADTEIRAVALADGMLAGLGRDIPITPGISAGQQGRLRWQLSIAPQPAAGTSVVLARIGLTVWGPSGQVAGRWSSLRILPPAPPP